MRRTQHRRDANHGKVMAVFKSLCPHVEDHSQGPHGYDALLMTSMGGIFAVEIKDGDKVPSKQKLTDNEKRSQAAWGSRYRVIKTVDEAIALCREGA